MKRTNQEYFLLVLSALTAVIVFPFAILRFLREEWLIGTVDLWISCSMALLFAYVYQTRKTFIPGIILSTFTILSAVVSVYIKGAVNIYWVYPAVVAAFYLLPRRWAILLIIVVLALLFQVLHRELPMVELLVIIATILMTSIFGFFYSKNIEEKHNRLSELATKDSLTGVGNRRALDERLQEVISSQNRKPTTVSLILLDIDYFKAVNDDHGHNLGDQILIQISQIIEGRIRVTDSLYRYGGEEFVIVPLELDVKAAERLAEQLRILVENYALIPDNPVTISLGVAQYKHGEPYESWMKRADEALYRAKNGGRNQVCISE